MELLNKTYWGPHIKPDRFYYLGDEKGGPYLWKTIQLATPAETVLLTKVLKSPESDEGRILLTPKNRQIGSSSFFSSLREVAVEPVLRCQPKASLTTFSTPGEIHENSSERKVRIQLNQEDSLKKDFWIVIWKVCTLRSYA